MGRVPQSRKGLAGETTCFKPSTQGVEFGTSSFAPVGGDQLKGIFRPNEFGSGRPGNTQPGAGISVYSIPRAPVVPSEEVLGGVGYIKIHTHLSVTPHRPGTSGTKTASTGGTSAWQVGRPSGAPRRFRVGHRSCKPLLQLTSQSETERCINTLPNNTLHGGYMENAAGPVFG